MFNVDRATGAIRFLPDNLRRLLLPALLLTAGCADVVMDATPIRSDRPASGKALVYFYRPTRIIGAGQGIEISDRNTPVGDLSSGSYFVFQAAPGAHQFMGNGHDETAAVVDLIAGHTYYYRCTIESGAWLPHYHVEAQLPQQALHEMAGLDRVRWGGH